MPIFDQIKIKRRYTRSVNLERDLEVADSVNGYIITPKIQKVIDRFVEALTTPDATRAWTITGVYGTGKSAFAHFLSALCSSRDDEIRKNAVKIFNASGGSSRKLSLNLHDKGLIKAVITAQREPIAHSLIRGLKYGADRYWASAPGPKSEVRSRLDKLYVDLSAGRVIENAQVLSLIKGLASSSRAGMIIVIDELGKNLEYSAQHQSSSDLYLLQQIAELPAGAKKPKVFFLGLLHQAFYEYSHGLATTQRNEWIKIQGRFEDIPLSESTSRLVHLIANAIDYDAATPEVKRDLVKWGATWRKELEKLELAKSSLAELPELYPCHPITALTLPTLCNKFSQNDRTLFTFLASDEPHSFKSFLKSTELSLEMPTLKPHQLYDYFIETAGINMASRSHMQRWLEVQGRIDEASGLDEDSIVALKTIGILNLVSGAAPIKASYKILNLALVDSPSSKAYGQWDNIIEGLISKGLVTYRRFNDEYRLWEGSDFDIEDAVSEEKQKIHDTLSEILSSVSPLKPVIARRHSYKTGGIRYFERAYSESIPNPLRCKSPDADGIILYITGALPEKSEIQSYTTDGRPAVIICASGLESLRVASREYKALLSISENRSELQSDGVARKEVRQRLFVAEKILNDTLSIAFDYSGEAKCWVLGKQIKLSGTPDFNSMLSNICDQVYSKGLVLWNELINRRELSSQGAKARRELIEAMLSNDHLERLGIVGNGPEYSMYESVLRRTGIHAKRETAWCIDKPDSASGIMDVWSTIEDFCVNSTETARSLDGLYELLKCPPYGVKPGIIPVLLLAVIQYHSDYLSVYIEGSYIPVLGPEHFELLVKKPELFAVKYFQISGLKRQLFEELTEIFSATKISPKGLRNATLLGIVNPLVKFVQKLSKYSLQADTVSDEAKAVRKALIEAKDPDDLLFRALPQACGFPFIDAHASSDSKLIVSFKKSLIQTLQELQLSYDRVLSYGQVLLSNAFSAQRDLQGVREYMRAIAGRVNANTQVVELNLKRFIQAIIETNSSDKAWLESVLMVIADKPVESWTDTDKLTFEVKLGDLIKRFKNVEAIIDLSPVDKKGIDAQKLTITHQDGREFSEVLWLEEKEKAEVASIISKIKPYLTGNDKINKAILSAIIEEIIPKDISEQSESKNKKKHHG
jgi:hypothetical protein